MIVAGSQEKLQMCRENLTVTVCATTTTRQRWDTMRMLVTCDWHHHLPGLMALGATASCTLLCYEMCAGRRGSSDVNGKKHSTEKSHTFGMGLTNGLGTREETGPVVHDTNELETQQERLSRTASIETRTEPRLPDGLAQIRKQSITITLPHTPPPDKCNEELLVATRTGCTDGTDGTDTEDEDRLSDLSDSEFSYA